MNSFLKLLSNIAPNTVAKQIYKKISNPKNRKLRAFEEQILAGANSASVQFRKFSLKEYKWGTEGQPIALLVHGWEGQAGNFGAMVPILINKGFKVFAYDGPSHGESTKSETNMFEYGDFIGNRIEALKPDLIISHSFGTVSTLLGLLKESEYYLKQWIIITTPFSFMEYIKSIQRKMGLSKRTLKYLAKLIEKDAAYPLEDINMATLCPKMNDIKSITIIHSENDKILSIKDAERTSKYMKGSELIKLQKLGHYKILWSEELKEILNKKIKTAHNKD